MSTIKDAVKEKYGQAALRVVSGSGCSLLRIFHFLLLLNRSDHIQSV